MEGAKACVASCELPTGVVNEGQILKTVKFRELAGPEEDILASNMPAAQKMTELMANCVMEFGNVSGPKVKSLVEKMVITDRWFYLIQLRILSLGAQYQFETICPNCATKDKVRYDLMKVRVTNPPIANQLIQETVLPSGRRLRWRVMDAEIDAKVERIVTEKNKASAGLYARCTELDDKPPALSDIVGLSMRDRSTFRDEIDKKEGKVDDEYEATCPKCSHKYVGELQLDGKSFFSL